jgi:hypothetical protein
MIAALLLAATLHWGRTQYLATAACSASKDTAHSVHWFRVYYLPRLTFYSPAQCTPAQWKAQTHAWALIDSVNALLGGPGPYSYPVPVLPSGASMPMIVPVNNHGEACGWNR